MIQERFEVTVVIPTLDEFQRRFRQYARHAREDGAFLFELLTRPASLLKASFATDDLELPAVAGVAADCATEAAGRGIDLNGYARQFIGAVVCVVMEANGYVKTGKKRSIPHRSFTKGEVYRRIAA